MKWGLVALGLFLGLLAVAYGVYLWVVNTVEKPNYTVVVADGPYEIRDYPEMIVAEVTRRGTRAKAVNEGFGPLAAYIFAKRREGDQIAMTAPVTQTRDENGEDVWVIRFIMPAEYTLETLPRPADADVRLVRLPPQRRTAVKFSGVATDALISEKEAGLRTWMASRNLDPLGQPTYAYYNDPFTPGFMRRNEVLFDVAAE